MGAIRDVGARAARSEWLGGGSGCRKMEAVTTLHLPGRTTRADREWSLKEWPNEGGHRVRGGVTAQSPSADSAQIKLLTLDCFVWRGRATRDRGQHQPAWSLSRVALGAILQRSRQENDTTSHGCRDR